MLELLIPLLILLDAVMAYLYFGSLLVTMFPYALRIRPDTPALRQMKTRELLKCLLYVAILAVATVALVLALRSAKDLPM